ncbi:CTP synthase [Candidatus Marinamargulisbacteria bacterium SCGC AG-343-D04]|nr:CTP synthase [Candidatus Marinamargulisbacteria bacterium SCGC AG-343-D04]
MTKNNTKYIFITGGVTSSLGKGIVGASLGVLLKDQGHTVTLQKFDPYLNLDPGTMNPYEHGEVFVTEDGCETDLDLGHYERFIDKNLYRVNNVTSGMIFHEVLTKERRGDYLGNTVQIIPHVTNEIKKRIMASSQTEITDIVITEIGGTIGDIESLPFLEAIRQFQFENKENCIHMHLTLIPYLDSSGEFKTKPTQHSVKELRTIGIQTDILICRSTNPFPIELKKKIALFCDVTEEAVIMCQDAPSIYDVPLLLKNEKLDQVTLKKLSLDYKEAKLTEWKQYTDIIHKEGKPTISICLVGKYTTLSDSYISVVEALKHAAAANACDCKINLINSEDLENKKNISLLETCDGILVPGGFGDRGIEGKILASKYARENNIPYLGLCLGMHVAIIDFARHVLHLENAHSSEFKSTTSNPVIDILPHQKDIKEKGGTMRLGAYPCKIQEQTKLYDAYELNSISERHRHRYEFNNTYKKQFEEKGVIFSGTSPDQKLVEVIELKDHAWFVACQFHPEFKSRPYKPHPLFKSFIKESYMRKKLKTQKK